MPLRVSRATRARREDRQARAHLHRSLDRLDIVEFHHAVHRDALRPEDAVDRLAGGDVTLESDERLGEAVSAFCLDGRFGAGVGSAVMVINAALLSAYALGCHSCRHMVGGRHDSLSCGKARHGAWRGSTWCNERHMLLAWCSLVGVAFTDFYI